MKEKIQKVKIALKKLALVSLGAIIGLSVYIAYQNYTEVYSCLK